MPKKRILKRIVGREIGDIWKLIGELREKYGDRTWQPIVEAEIMADAIAEKVVERMLPNLPRPERIKPIIQPPHEKTLSKLYEFIEEVDKEGSLVEFSLTTTNTNFKVYLQRDGESLVPGLTYTELMSLSPDIAWLTAVQKPATSEYWLQFAGLDFRNKLVIAVEPQETIRFYNISWTYMLIERR